jgi:hypothetical protein
VAGVWSGNWSDTNHWSTSAGGVGGSSVPSSSDDVFIVGGATVGQVNPVLTVDVAAFCNSLDFLNPTHGAAPLNSGMIINLAADLTVSNGLSVDTKGPSPGNPNTGQFNCNGFNVTAGGVFLDGPSINMGGGDWTINQTVSSSSFYSGGLVSVGTSNLFINYTGSGAANFTFSGLTAFNQVTITGNGVDAFTVAVQTSTIDSLTVSNGPIVLPFYYTTTLSTNSITLDGSVGGISVISTLIDLVTPYAGFTLSSGLATINDTYVQGVHATNNVPFYDNPGGTDGGGNVNWVFGPPTTPPLATYLAPTFGLFAGHTLLTIHGHNFIAGDTSVTIGGNTVLAADVTVGAFGNYLFFYTPAHAVGAVDVTVTTSNGTSSPPLTYTYVDNSDASFYLQNISMIGSDTNGTVQTINAGRSDDGTPIYFELETQDLEFGNRLHLKKIADKIVAFTKFGIDSQLQAKTDENGYQPVPMDLFGRVNIGTNINLEGHYFTFKWFGESTDTTPVFEGIYLEDITDLGMTYG